MKIICVIMKPFKIMERNISFQVFVLTPIRLIPPPFQSSSCIQETDKKEQLLRHRQMMN